MSHKFLFYLIIFSWFFTPSSYADWLGTWMNNSMTSTYAPPQSFETKKAGYVTGGSFSTRYVMSNDPVISISKPRFESGCGGIDMFLGGFSFMQPEYLIEKMKRAMGSAAPAFAFDLALGMMSEGMRTSLSNVMDMVDALNGLQFDDCSMHNATKAVLTTTASGDWTREAYSKSTQEFMQNSGMSNLYKKSNEIFKSSSDDIDKTLESQGTSGTTELVAGCPQDLKDVFFKDGSLMKNALAHLNKSSVSIPTYFLPYIRGLFGDIAVVKTNFSFKEPLAQNAEIKLHDFIRGDFFITDSSGNPIKPEEFEYNGKKYKNLLLFTNETLKSIGTKILNDQDFTDTEKTLVVLMPLNIYKYIAAEVTNSGSDAPVVIDSLAHGLSEYVAAHIAYQAFSDLFASIKEVTDLPAKINAANSPGRKNTCKTELAQPAIALTEKIQTNIGKKMYSFFQEKNEILDKYIDVITANIQIEERNRARFEKSIDPVSN